MKQPSKIFMVANSMMPKPKLMTTVLSQIEVHVTSKWIQGRQSKRSLSCIQSEAMFAGAAVQACRRRRAPAASHSKAAGVKAFHRGKSWASAPGGDGGGGCRGGHAGAACS